MPSWPIAIPSSTAMVLNSLATPPAASISRATNCPRSFRCTWPGTNWVKELATATIGLPKSPSFMPVARHRPRAPAMLRPWVVVRERYGGMAFSHSPPPRGAPECGGVDRDGRSDVRPPDIPSGGEVHLGRDVREIFYAVEVVSP